MRSTNGHLRGSKVRKKQLGVGRERSTAEMDSSRRDIRRIPTGRGRHQGEISLPHEEGDRFRTLAGKGILEERGHDATDNPSRGQGTQVRQRKTTTCAEKTEIPPEEGLARGGRRTEEGDGRIVHLKELPQYLSDRERGIPREEEKKIRRSDGVLKVEKELSMLRGGHCGKKGKHSSVLSNEKGDHFTEGALAMKSGSTLITRRVLSEGSVQKIGGDRKEKKNSSASTRD